MKALLTLSALFVALSLSACGDKHQQTYAVDALEQAQATALANAPKAEPIKFDDENTAKAGTAATDAAPSDAATATAEATAPTANAEATAAPATADTAATAQTTEQSADTATATAEATATTTQ